MNKLLLNNKPNNITKEEFTKLWNNNSICLEALGLTLLSIKENINSITKADFDCPNHYAKLAYNLGQTKMIDTVLEMLPDSAKGNDF